MKWGDKILYAHRVSYEISHGQIPPGMYVCHSCDNKQCVNPSHLWAGTARDNLMDAHRKGLLQKESGEFIWASLTVSAVRDLRAGKITDAEVSERFGVTKDAARFARVGKTWKHLSGGSV